MGNGKNMTEQQILMKLTSVCAKGEHCKEDMRVKMRKWNVDEETQERVLNFLVEERYIDESRYTSFFINDKIKYNKWGKRKVEQALYVKHIPKDIYEPILNEIEEDEYEDILLPLLVNKEKNIKANSEYEKRGKLIRFALQRGYSMEQAIHCLDIMKSE